MIKYKLHIFLFILISSKLGYAQLWSGCGQGFPGGTAPTALFSDPISNKLYVSGFSTTVDGTLTANGVASWDGTQWDTLGHGALGTSDEFLIRYNNKLYVQRNDNIYAWDFNTLTWDSVPGGYVNGGIVKTAAIYNNELIIVGEFAKIGSVTAHNIARFDGTNFYPVGNPSFSYYIRAVEVFQNEIYIGGNFGSDTIYSAIAKWNGSSWVDLDLGFRGGGPPEVATLKVYNNRLYAGGSFYGTKDKYLPSLAAWDGIKWNNLGAGIYYNANPWGVIYKLHIWNNKLLVCGNFDRAGDIDVKNLAFWNDTNWCSLIPQPYSWVWASAIYQNTLYIANYETLDSDTVNLLGYWIGGNIVDACGARFVGVKEIKISDNIKIYPNPANSIINISDEENELQNSTIQITNSIGQSVIAMPFNNSIDVSILSTGCYFLNITTERKQVLHSKFIKE